MAAQDGRHFVGSLALQAGPLAFYLAFFGKEDDVHLQHFKMATQDGCKSRAFKFQDGHQGLEDGFKWVCQENHV